MFYFLLITKEKNHFQWTAPNWVIDHLLIKLCFDSYIYVDISIYINKWFLPFLMI